MKRYTHVRRAVLETPWAMHPTYFEAMLEVLDRRLEGDPFSSEEVEARILEAARPREALSAPRGVAVLPLRGLISHRAGSLEEVSGGTSTERFEAAFRRAVADDSVEAIVLDVDSPGGSVFGVEELGDVIFGARGSKPVVAVANAWAASAAYWLASQADELVVTPSGEVGSIGVIAAHDDLSGAAEQAGIRRTYVTAGRFKAEGNEFEPLGDEARTFLQSRVDDYYDAFVSAVARGRGVKRSTVRGEAFGEGRMIGAAQAVEVGLADREGTLRSVLERLTRQSRRRRQRAGLVAVAEVHQRRNIDTSEGRP